MTDFKVKNKNLTGFHTELGFELWELFIVLSVVFSIGAGILWWTSVMPRSREEDFIVLEQHKHVLYSKLLIIRNPTANKSNTDNSILLETSKPQVAQDLLEQSSILKLDNAYQDVISKTHFDNNTSEFLKKDITTFDDLLKQFENWEKKYIIENPNIQENPVYLII